MGHFLRQYRQTFHISPRLWKPYLLDILFFGLLAISFTEFSQWVQNTSLRLLQGIPIATLQNYLATLPPEEALTFLNQLQGFVTVVAVATLLYLLASFLLFSYSRCWIENLLHEKSRYPGRDSWRWNVLHLALVVPVFLYFLAMLAIKGVLTALFQRIAELSPSSYLQYQQAVQAILGALGNVVTIIIFIFFLLGLFSIYDHFWHNRKAWASLGEAWAGAKRSRQKWGMMALTGILLSALLTLLHRLLFIYPFSFDILQFFLILAFVAWLRQIAFNSSHQGSPHHG